MKLDLAILSLFLIAEPSSTPRPQVKERAILEFEGQDGVKVFGKCIYRDSEREVEVSGVTPGRIELDIGIRKCSLQKEGRPSALKLRLSYKGKVISSRVVDEPMAGFEFVFPIF